MNRFVAAWRVLTGKAKVDTQIKNSDPPIWTEEERAAYLKAASLGECVISRVIAADEDAGRYYEREHYQRPDDVHPKVWRDRIHRGMQRALSKPQIIPVGKMELASMPTQESEISGESQIPVEQQAERIEESVEHPPVDTEKPADNAVQTEDPIEYTGEFDEEYPEREES